MGSCRKYRKKADQFVIAIQVALQTEGFSYTKWGGDQRCKPGDWLVNNNGDIYTVDKEVFARTYRQVKPGAYVKTTPVWAEVADGPGSVKTREGTSRYHKGDYLVSNDEEGTDRYCMNREKFEAMYEPD